jgi:hypothetical protein
VKRLSVRPNCMPAMLIATLPLMAQAPHGSRTYAHLPIGAACRNHPSYAGPLIGRFPDRNSSGGIRNRCRAVSGDAPNGRRQEAPLPVHESRCIRTAPTD